MHRLVVPAQRPCLEVEGDRAVAEEVDADPCRPVVVGRRVAGVDVDHAEVRVDRGLRPDAAAGPRAVAPGVPGDLPALVLRALRNRVEHPPDGPGGGVGGDDQPARDVSLGQRRGHVQRAVVVGGRGGDAVADLDRVEGRRIVVGVLHLQRVADDRQHAPVAERLDGGAGAGVPRVQVGAAIGVDVAAREGGTAHRAAARGPRVERRRPQFGPGCRVEGEQGRARVQVHHAVDDQGRGLGDVVGRSDHVGPPLDELADVPGVDLVQRGEPVVVEVEVLAGPVGGRRLREGGRAAAGRDRGERECGERRPSGRSGDLILPHRHCSVDSASCARAPLSELGTAQLPSWQAYSNCW